MYLEIHVLNFWQDDLIKLYTGIKFALYPYDELPVDVIFVYICKEKIISVKVIQIENLLIILFYIF